MEKLDHMINGILKTKKLRKRWLHIASVLSVFVFAAVVWRLTVPVITMSADPDCGMEEHIHSDACYEVVVTCGMEENEDHEHTSECYDTIQTCGMEEHIHTDSCYPQDDEEEEIIAADEVMGEDFFIDEITDQNDVLYGDSDEDVYQEDGAADIVIEDTIQIDDSFAQDDDTADLIAGLMLEDEVIVSEPEIQEIDGVVETADLFDEEDDIVEDGDTAYIEGIDDEEIDAEEENKVTITFRIDEEDYTGHLQTDKYTYENFQEEERTIDELEDTILVIEDDSRYLITGTGILYSVEITEGTSLIENDLRFPDITVINENEGTAYQSEYEWKEGDRIWEETTIAAADTVLTIELKEADIMETEGGKEDAAVEIVESADVQSETIEETADEPVIETEMVTEAPTEIQTETQTYSNADTEGIAEQETEEETQSETVTEEGIETETEVETESVTDSEIDTETVTEGETDTKAENERNNTVVIDMDAMAFPDTEQDGETSEENLFTVSFYQTDPTDESLEAALAGSVEAEAGTAFGESFIEEEIFSGYLFAGWFFADENGEESQLTVDSIIDSDLDVYTSYIRRAQMVRSVLRRAPGTSNTTTLTNGTGTVTITVDGDTTTMTITAAQGESLTAADFVIDGVNYADVSRYTWTNQNGQTVNIQELLSENLTQEISLTLTNTTTTLPTTGGTEKSVVFNTEGNRTTITIQITIGDTLSASDFVYNGIDYTLYNWTITGTDTSVDLNDLIDVPMTQELIDEIATYEYVEEEDTEDTTETAVGSINFYVNIAGTWEKVTGSSVSMTLRRMYITYEGSTRYTYVITAAQLESIYSAYGFKASDQEPGLVIFRHGEKVDTLSGREQAWGNRRPFEYEGVTYVQLLESTPDCNVYYLPGDALDNGNRAVDVANMSVDDLTANNILYSITVENAEGTELSSLPFTTYVLSDDTDATITLPQLPNGYTWTSNLSTPIGTIVSSDASQITYQLVYNSRATITKNTVIYPKQTETETDDKKVRFWISINGEWTCIGSNDGTEVSMVKVAYTDTNNNTQRETYALTAEQLEEYYGEYGYSAEDVVVGESLFKHASYGSETIYGNRGAFIYGDTTYVPLLNYDDWTVVDLYYMPNNKEISSSSTTTSASAANNTFYTITITDQNNNTETSYALAGGTEVIVLPVLTDGAYWSVNGSYDESGEVDTEENTVTYTFENLSSAVTIAPQTATMVEGGYIYYWASINGSWTVVEDHQESTTVLKISQAAADGSSKVVYAVAATEVAKWYAKYGLTTADIQAGKSQFWYGLGDSEITKGAVAAFNYNGSVYVPVFYEEDNSTGKLSETWDQTYAERVNLFYYPNSTTPTTTTTNYTNHRTTDTLYSVTVSNPNSVSGIDDSYLITTYVAAGGSITIQLPILGSDYFWSVNGSIADTGVYDTDSDTVTYTLENISQATTLQPMEKQVSTASFNVNFYASVNEAWELVMTRTVTSESVPYNTSGNTTYTLDPDVLADVYQAFGLTSNDIKVGETMFYYSFVNDNTIWGDRPTFQYATKVYVPIFTFSDNTNSTINVYYAPVDAKNINSMQKEESAERNTFYTVTVSAGSSGEAVDSQYLTTTYVAAGGSTTVTLPILTGYDWQPSSGSFTSMINNGDDTMTCTLEGVTTAVTISPVSPGTVDMTGTIRYFYSRNEGWRSVDVTETTQLLFYQTVAADGTIKNVYAVSAAEVANRLAGYVTVDEIVSGEAAFWHSLSGGETNGAVSAFTYNGQVYVPLFYEEELTDGAMPSNVNLFYYPNYKTASAETTNYADHRVTDTLYTVQVTNPDGVAYVDTDAALPETKYVVTGRSTTVTVPKLADETYTWNIAAIAGDPIENEEDNTLTYTIDSVTVALTISPQKTDETEVTKNIRFWVCIDEEWVLLTGKSMAVPVLEFGTSLIEVSELERVYGEYGFEAEDILPGMFRYSNGSPYNLYIGGIYTYDGVTYQVVQDDTAWKTSDLYYLPTAPTGNTSNVISADDRTVTDTFYSITVEDPLGYALSELPDVQYVFTGESATITLPALEDGRSWVAEGIDLTGGVENGDGSVTYTIEAVTNKITIRPQNDRNIYTIRYVIEADYSETIDISDADEEQVWDPDTFPNVEGSQNYTVTYNSAVDGRYTVLYPSDNYAQTYKNFSVNANKGLQRYTYSFAGWKVNGDQEVIWQPGDVINASELLSYANEFGEIVLSPRWHMADDNTDKAIESVGFYVQIDSKIHDRSKDNIDPNNYTYNQYYSDSVYSTVVYNGKYADSVDQDQYNQRVIWATDSEETGIEADAQIRKLATEGYTTTQNDGESEVTIRLAQFPTDEEVLANLRNWALRDPVGYYKNLTVDNVPISLDQLTTKNFTIRWYVFKYDVSNGWHIDGLLVPKKGHITIKKTFMGDEATIAAVEEGDYQIVLDSNWDDEANIILTLDGNDETVAPTYSDPTNHTYTWVVEINQLTQYTINEVNYEGGSNVATHARYSITNSENNKDTNGMVEYAEDKIVVTGFAYNTDQYYDSYQTVALENDYRTTETIALRKIDAVTGQGMKNIEFTLTDEDDNPLTVYAYNGQYYLTLESAQADAGEDNAGSIVTYTDGKMVTGENGTIYVVGSQVLFSYIRANPELYPNGMYLYLTETTPVGYEPIGTIPLILRSDGSVIFGEGKPDGVTCEQSTINGVTFCDAIVMNTPLKTNLTVVKEWPNTAESDKQQVTVALVKNGSRIDAETKVINAANNWTVTWEDLPLYENGTAITYGVQEIVIGDDPMTAEYYDISGDKEDGFTKYTVTYSNLVYRYTDGTQSSALDLSKAEQLQDGYLVVRNSVYQRNITLTKIDFETGHPLAGAVFALYATQADALSDENRLQTATGSTEDGHVTFDQVRVGTYYIREREAPYGYVLDDTIYVVKVERYGYTVGTLMDENGNVGTALDAKGNAIKSSSSITNQEIQRTDLEILKQDNEANADNTYNVLQGAQFQLWYYDEDKQGYTKVPESGITVEGQTVRAIEGDPYITTGEDGRAVFTGLLPGRYQITEEKSPDGYYKLSETIAFTVAQDGTIADASGTAWELRTTTGSDGASQTSIILTIKNQKGAQLPMTGGPGTLPYIYGGLLLIAASLWMIYARRCGCERRGE